MQLTKWLPEPIWISKFIHGPWCRVTQIQHFIYFFFRNCYADWSQISFVSSMVWGNKCLFKWVQVTWPIWPPCPYMLKVLKPLKILTLKLVMQHCVLKYYQVCSNYDPELILTYFMARLNLVPYAFVWEKKANNGFFRNYLSQWYQKQLVDAVKLVHVWTFMNIKGQGHSLTFVQGHWDSTFSNFFPSKTLGWLKPYFMWSLHLMEEWSEYKWFMTYFTAKSNLVPYTFV